MWIWFERLWAYRRISRRTALCLLLAAFVAQSVTTLVHLHGAQGALATVAKVSRDNAPPPKQPSDRGDPSCPICQTASVVGHAVAPSALFVPAPEARTVAAPQWREVVAAQWFVNHWRSRAPPSI